jgi:molybdopterin/thiamine biosynthesis adenylyltransferase
MILTNEHLTRQLDLIPVAVLQEPITIIGAGAIGSFSALMLAKMGFDNITVYDYDTVDVVNMNSQFYRFSDIGKLKAVALRDLVHDFTKVTLTIKPERYIGGVFPGIVISAVDSMGARRLIWEQHYQIGVRTRLIIDPRMGAESAALYSVRPMDRVAGEKYARSLYSDAEALQERCTAKSTMYCVGPLSGLVCKVVKEAVTGELCTKSILWDVMSNKFIGWKEAAK